MQENQTQEPSRIKNADDLLVSQMTQSTEPVRVEVSEVPKQDLPPLESSAPNESIDAPEEAPPADNYDDYGNPVKSQPEMISWEEHKRILNETIRNRVKNWSPEAQQQALAPEPTYPQSQNVPRETSQDTSQDWEKELKSFVKNSYNEIRAEEYAEQQRRIEAQKMSEFESKFNQSAERYSDFSEVVFKQQLSPAMIKATMGMPDAAAFLYAASKNHGSELSKIAQIQDPLVQATEIGRLEERMRKSRNVTAAPPPVTQTARGDVPNTEAKKSIETLIREDALSRRKR